MKRSVIPAILDGPPDASTGYRLGMCVLVHREQDKPVVYDKPS